MLGKCQSRICIKQRATIPVLPVKRYETLNYCTGCITYWPKETIKCGCCNLFVRSRSRSPETIAIKQAKRI